MKTLNYLSNSGFSTGLQTQITFNFIFTYHWHFDFFFVIFCILIRHKKTGTLPPTLLQIY